MHSLKRIPFSWSEFVTSLSLLSDAKSYNIVAILYALPLRMGCIHNVLA